MLGGNTMKKLTSIVLMCLMCLAVASMALAQTDNVRKSRFTRGGQADLVCPDVDQEVCGRDRKTYANACEARKAGMRFGPGSCDRGRGITCPAIFKPVCGVKDGEKRTFPNSCRANAQGVQRFEEGPCEGTPQRTPAEIQETICPNLVKPVCGSDGITYENRCKAEQSDVDYKPGVCRGSVRDFARGKESRKVGLPERADKKRREESSGQVRERLDKFGLGQSKEHVRKSKEELTDQRSKARGCKQQRTSECKEARKNLRGGLFKVYHDVAHKRTLRLDQAETRITNAGLSPEERDAFLERLEAQRAKLEELREKAESFDDDTTKEELKAYVAELREAQENSRRSVNVGRAHGVTNKLRNAKNALNKQLERVRTVTTDRELDFAAGIDTVQADIDKIDEFSNKLLELISDGDIEDAKEVMKEARNHVRDTHKALKDLISEVRTALQAE